MTTTTKTARRRQTEPRRQGAAAAGAGEQPIRGQTLRRSGGCSPHLDPQISSGGTHPVLNQIYDRLLEFQGGDPEIGGSIVSTVQIPGLVQSIEEPDGATLILHIQDGVNWHNKPPVNGRAFTAEDVAWNLDFYTTDLGKGKTLSSNWANLDNYEVVDSDTIRLNYKEPLVINKWLLSVDNNSIMPREVFERDGHWRDAVVGTGAFMADVDDCKTDSGINMFRNPDYWRTGRDGQLLPYLDKVEYFRFGDYASKLAAILAGQLDISWSGGATLADLQENDVERVRATGDFNVISSIAPAMQWITFNSQNPDSPLADERVRKACQKAISQELASEAGTGWQGASDRDYSRQHAGLGVVCREGGREVQAGRARSQQADPGGWAVPASRRIIFSNYSNRPQVLGTYEAVNQMWSDAGINVEPFFIEVTKLAAYRISLEHNAISGTGPAQLEPDDWLWSWHHSASAKNVYSGPFPEYDALADSQRAEFDPDRRKELVDECQEWLWEHAVMQPLYCYPSHLSTRKTIRGIGPHGSYSAPGMYRTWIAEA